MAASRFRGLGGERGALKFAKELVLEDLKFDPERVQGYYLGFRCFCLTGLRLE